MRFAPGLLATPMRQCDTWHPMEDRARRWARATLLPTFARPCDWAYDGGGRRIVIPIDLTPAQETMLRQEAESLGVPPELLARMAVEDLLDRPHADFQEAARQVLDKNRELYERLA